MKDNGEFISLIDLGKSAQKNFTNYSKQLLTPTSSWIEHQDYLNEKLIDLNLEQSAIFSEIHLDGKMNTNQENATVEHHELSSSLSSPVDQSMITNLNTTIITNPINRKSMIKNKLMNLSINNPVLSASRNNYEKLTDSLLVRPDNSRYYGSFSKAANRRQSKTIETAFNGVISSVTNDHDHLSAGASINSQNLMNAYLKEFEHEKHLNLLGFKTILIVILSFCFLINLIFTFKVYYDLKDDKLLKFQLEPPKPNDQTIKYWRVTWVVNSIVTLVILSIGIIGLLKEKVILILITSVCMMLSLMESDDPINGLKIFNISLLTILITSVLLIIFAARLRCYAEDKLNLINQIQYM